MSRPLSDDRILPGIDWNISGQLEIIENFHFADELLGIPNVQTDELSFFMGNGAFEAGDAEFWYSIIRKIKPRRIIEIGSGSSTRMAVKAIIKNKEDDPLYTCEHICIEPYEQPWLSKLDVVLIREKVENIKLEFFSQLDENDILFIDSSHIIRPQGDVLYEYLEVLPSLKSGVIVHIHDIFSPRDYLKSWVVDEVKFWNEQYLLEAFLTLNNKWKIIGAVNWLHHNHFDKLVNICPYLTSKHEPGSFYIKKI